MNMQTSYVLNDNGSKHAGFSEIHEQEPQSDHGFRHGLRNVAIHDGRILQTARKERIQFKTKLQSERLEAYSGEFNYLPPVVSGIASQTSGGLTEENIIESDEPTGQPDVRKWN